jgi:hypothetical protein
MLRRVVCLGMLAGVSMVLASGCKSPGMSMDDMVQPPRPAELDHLQQFVGKWRGEWTMKVMGMDEPIKSSGVNEVKWDLNGRYLVEHMKAEMGDGKVMESKGVWTYDPRAKKYRTWWFDDWSGVGEGTAKYCPETRTFCMKGKSKVLAAGHKTVGEGCVRFVDDNTMEWCWRERIPWTWITIMEFTGTSKRQ